MRAGLRKGLLGGSRPWLYVGVAAAGARLLARMARREEEVVYREELQPGESVVVSTVPPAPRG